MLFALVLLFLKTRDCYIRVEITDPKIKVALDDGKVSITTSKGDAIQIGQGENKLRGQRGDLEFETHRFTIGGGDNPKLVVE